MPTTAVILHAGALGDLVLTIQLALRLPPFIDTGRLHLISRTDPGDLSTCQPSITRESSEGFGLHWLFGNHNDPPPAALRSRIAGHTVLSALGGTHTIIHQRLKELHPARLYSLDPRPRDNVQRHITHQWQTQLEGQGLLVPKCIHQHPDHRTLGVPDALRADGRQRLAETGAPGGTIIHPGSGGQRKCWPLAGFVSLARQLDDSRGVAARPAILLGPVELESWPPAQREQLAAFPRIIAPTPSELIALLAGAKTFIGNDAGPTHLAALLGTPTIAIFGPTSPNIWHPLGRHVTIIPGDPAAADDWSINPATILAAIK